MVVTPGLGHHLRDSLLQLRQSGLGNTTCYYVLAYVLVNKLFFVCRTCSAKINIDYISDFYWELDET